MNKQTTFKILQQGSVKMAHMRGYMLVGGPDAVCFYIDPENRGYVNSSSVSDSGCPMIWISDEDDLSQSTQIEFTEFPGWEFHSGGGGKCIAIALVRKGSC